ncbi:MAG: AsmA-like C-terminal region-containing protein [Pseudomonadota bacterium]
MVRQTARVLIFEILGGILFLAILAAALFAWRLSQGPVQLDAFKSDIEAALTDARGGRDVSLGSVALEWSPETRRVNVTAYGLEFRDSRGEPSGDAHRAEFVLDASALLLGEAEILSMRLIDGSLQVEQVSDSVWEIAGEPLPPIPAGTLPTTPAEWLGLVERVMAAGMDGGRGAAAAMRLEDIAFQDFTVDVVMQDGSRLVRVADAEGGLVRSDGDLRVTLSGRGEGAGLPRGIALDVHSETQFDTLHGEIAFAGWTVSDLLLRIGIVSERATGLPADMSFAFEFRDGDGLTGFSAELDAGEGEILLAERTFGLERVTGRLDYDPIDDVAALTVDELQSGFLSGRFRLQLEDAIEPETAVRPVSLTADALAINLSPMFERPLEFGSVALEGEADLTDHALDISSLSAEVGTAEVTASGTLARLTDLEAGDLPFSLEAEARVEGPLDVPTVTGFWPVRLGDGARRFVVEKVEAGTVTEADATITLGRDSFRSGRLRDEDLDVRFTATDARVRYLSDLPPVDNATGTGRLTGNGIEIDLATGTVGSWQLTSGSVAIPAFHPRGGDINILATGEGSATDMLNYVFNSDLQLEASTGFDPDRVTGDARASFEMRRPALDNVMLADMDFRVVAEVTDGGLEDLGAGFDLTGARARVDVDKTAVRVTGNGMAGPANIAFAWRDDFTDGDEPSQLTAQAIVTPDIMNAFGLLGRPYLSGEIPVDVTATLDGNDLRTADLDFDLTGSRIDLAEIGWLKPPGDAARAIVKYDFSGDAQIASADLQSQMAGLSGDLILGPDGRLQRFDLRRAFLADRADVAGQIVRDADGGFTLSLEGPFLDASPLVADLGVLGAQGSGTGGTPVRLTANVDRLRFGVDRDLLEATFEARTDQAGVDRMAASGTTATGDRIDARYQREGKGADVSLVGEDAGFLMGALFGSDVLEDGTIDLSGRLEWEGAPSNLVLTITGTRLRNAPILTQLLSIASLRGLVDTLGGEGVLFSEIRIPVQIVDGRYIMEGGRASGPALGLTLNGWLEPESQKLDLSGVLVPSFGVNSALGGIPIIGDLMVGREGEGILSLTYSVRGELDRAQVAVNPLSAVAPGVLRRIFENPADTDLPLPGETGQALDGAGQ